MDTANAHTRKGDTAGKRSGNPHFFIVGCPRSGTTLLRRMVDVHPDISVMPESHWIAKYYKKRIGLGADCVPTAELITSLLEYGKFQRLGIERQALEQLLESGAPPSYQGFVAGVFDLYGKMHNKSVVGDKTPGYVKDIPVLHELWPESRFVHLIRDGRDVCLSIMGWDKAHKTTGRFEMWNDDPVSTAALYWEWHIELGREASRVLGPDLYYPMSYESLVANPKQESKALCEFLGVPYDELMLSFHAGRTKAKDGLSAKKAWLPVTRGIRDWRSQMSPDDIERFEATTGDLLDALGYERAFPTPDSAKVGHALKARERFYQDPRIDERLYRFS